MVCRGPVLAHLRGIIFITICVYLLEQSTYVIYTQLANDYVILVFANEHTHITLHYLNVLLFVP